MLAIRVLLMLANLGARARQAVAAERGAEVPEYVLVVAIVAMLAVVGLVAVKTGLLANLTNISNCLTGAAQGSSSACT